MTPRRIVIDDPHQGSDVQIVDAADVVFPPVDMSQAEWLYIGDAPDVVIQDYAAATSQPVSEIRRLVDLANGELTPPSPLTNIDGPDWREDYEYDYCDVLCPTCKDPIYGLQCGGCRGGY